MGLNVANEVAALRRMTVPDLRRRYAEVFGEETRCRHKDYLWRRIIWRMQAREEGDLSERARRRAEELADDTHLRVRAPRRTQVAAAVPQRPAATVADMPKDARRARPRRLPARHSEAET